MASRNCELEASFIHRLEASNVIVMLLHHSCLLTSELAVLPVSITHRKQAKRISFYFERGGVTSSDSLANLNAPKFQPSTPTVGFAGPEIGHSIVTTLVSPGITEK